MGQVVPPSDTPEERTGVSTRPRLRRRGLGMLAGPLLAVQFLTVLPVSRYLRSEGTQDAPDMAAALPWFPAVGAALGAFLATGDALLAHVLARGVRDALILVVMAGATGMLHFDGFLDACDGLIGRRSPERRLEILRDSRVGAYGVTGGVLLVLTLYAALEALPAGIRSLALVGAPLAGRWAMVYAVAMYPYSRALGAGSSFRARRGHLIPATVFAAVLLLCALLLLAPQALSIRLALWLGIAVVSVAVIAVWCAWASRRIGGGLTGDLYGAGNELVEAAVLLVCPVLVSLAHGIHIV